MAFKFKKTERKFGPANMPTEARVGPGCYLGPDSMLAYKKRISVREPFASMVDRDGRNAQSWQNLNEVKAQNQAIIQISNPHLLPPYHSEIVQQNRKSSTAAQTRSKLVPGPGQYEVSVGFDQIHRNMKQVQEFR